MKNPGEVTQLLKALNSDEAALAALIPVVYDELHKIAKSYMSHERPDHTLQATALVNEAFIRLIDCKNIEWRHRAQFFAIAAHLMRNILVDHARSHQAAKRGGNLYKITLNDANDLIKEPDLDLVALNDALVSLEKMDARQCKIVELRFFAGMNIEEIAEALQISPATVSREWSFAKAWLMREISSNG
jgi:RNA polymerase sigma factor (TIGR02999 family)